MFYFAGIILSLFFAFVLFTKKGKNTSDYLLAVWLLFIGWHLGSYYLTKQDYYLVNPALIGLGLPLPLVHGAFLYVYIKALTDPKPMTWSILIYFTPFVFAYFIFAPFFFLSHEDQINVYKNEGHPYEKRLLIHSILLNVVGVFYIIRSYLQLSQYRQSLKNQFSNIEKIRLDWLTYLIVWIGLLWLVIIFIQKDALIFAVAVFFILWLGYFGIRQVSLFQNSDILYTPSSVILQTRPGLELTIPEPENEIKTGPIKYQKSSLSDEASEEIYSRLKEIMQNEKCYKDPEIRLTQLANYLNVNPNYLSQVINSKENKNFYDFINEYRVQEFKDSLTVPANKNYTLLALAMECGFNSKTSFNRNFKKVTGIAPTEYASGLK